MANAPRNQRRRRRMANAKAKAAVNHRPSLAAVVDALPACEHEHPECPAGDAPAPASGLAVASACASSLAASFAWTPFSSPTEASADAAVLPPSPGEVTLASPAGPTPAPAGARA